MLVVLQCVLGALGGVQGSLVLLEHRKSPVPEWRRSSTLRCAPAVTTGSSSASVPVDDSSTGASVGGASGTFVFVRQIGQLLFCINLAGMGFHSTDIQSFFQCVFTSAKINVKRFTLLRKSFKAHSSIEAARFLWIHPKIPENIMRQRRPFCSTR